MKSNNLPLVGAKGGRPRAKRCALLRRSTRLTLVGASEVQPLSSPGMASAGTLRALTRLEAMNGMSARIEKARML